MQAEELMTRVEGHVDEDTPIAEAWRTMKRLGVRHLPVVEEGRLVGIVSDRQLLTRAKRGLDGELEFPELCAAEVMTFHPRACGPRTPVQQVAAEMLDRRIEAVPVVTAEGQVLGVLTTADLVRYVAQS